VAVEQRTMRYREVAGVALDIHVFALLAAEQTPRPAILFFHGGGWAGGSPDQFFPQCRRLAVQGMVAMSAQYRLLDKGASSVGDCLVDAKAAVRWVGEHAVALGVDANRLAVGGGSAGAHLAACTVLVEGFDEGAGPAAARPSAMVLFNPVLDATGMSRAVKFGEHARALSPLYALDKPVPATILFQGSADTTTPPGTARAFAEKAAAKGGRCVLDMYEGRGHGFFNYRDGANPDYEATMARMEQFLREQGFIG
jgi:acetyl esterase